MRGFFIYYDIWHKDWNSQKQLNPINMKQILNFGKRIYFLLLFTFINLTLFAQDGGETSSKTVTTTSKTEVIIQPWMWIVGGAVLLIILIALLRGGRSTTSTSEKVIVTKTGD